ncbi:MAG: hypothetical protein ACOX5F_05325 [Anaerovoracaceae bacterium]|jgi:hypothetical protein
MADEAKIEKAFREELAKILEVEKLEDFPDIGSLEAYDLPDMDRWKDNE